MSCKLPLLAKFYCLRKYLYDEEPNITFLAVSSLLSVSMNKLLVSYDKLLFEIKIILYHFVHLVIH